MAAFHMSQESLSYPLYIFQLLLILCFDLLSGGWRGQEEFLIPGINGGSQQQRNPTYRGLNLTQQTKLSTYTLTVPTQSSQGFRFELSLAESAAC